MYLSRRMLLEQQIFKRILPRVKKIAITVGEQSGFRILQPAKFIFLYLESIKGKPFRIRDQLKRADLNKLSVVLVKEGPYYKWIS